jgi:hypothetical protein
MEDLMRTIRMVLLSILVAALAMGIPGVALAASAAPVLKSLVSIAASRADGQGSLIIAGELPDSAVLPAEVVIPIPKGANIAWVGEIVGSDPSRDPTATYSIARGKAYDIMTITVRKARIGQAELLVPLNASGGALLHSQSLPILGPVGVATLSFNVPSGTKIASASPSLVRAASAAGDRYSLTRKSPRRGTTLAASISVQSGAPGGAAASQTPPGAGFQTSPTSGGATGSSGAGPGSGVNPIVAMALAAVIGFASVAVWRYGSENMGRRAAQRTDGPNDAGSEQRPAPSSPRVGVEKPVKDRRPSTKDVEDDAEEVAEDTPEDVVDSVAEESGPAPVERHARAASAPEETVLPRADTRESVSVPAVHMGGDVVAQVKQVAALKTEGLLDAEEFASAKRRLLDGDLEVVGRLREIAALRTTGLLDGGEFAGSKRSILAGDAIDVLQIEELASLRASGGLTAEEFAAAKQSALSGDGRVLALLKELVAWASEGLLTELECSMAKEHLLTSSAEVIAQIEELAALKAEDLLTQEEFRNIVDRLLDT